jgi:H+/gluconate symporter-like permease
VLGTVWLQQRLRSARARGEDYGEAEPPGDSVPRRQIRAHAQSEGYDVVEIGPMVASGTDRALPGFAVAVAPVGLVVALNYLFSTVIIPALDTGYLAQPAYGSTTVASVKGIWAIICALTVSCLLVVLLNPSMLRDIRRTLDDGASASVLPIFNTASLVGFGAVVAALPAFAEIRDAVLAISPGNPLISLSVAVNVLAGITGSASGGMSIALQALGATYLDMGRAAGIDPELLHRVTAIATGGLDALPHNGAVITLLSICKLSHRDAYADIFVVAVAVPILALVAVVLLGTLFGSF